MPVTRIILAVVMAVFITTCSSTPLSQKSEPNSNNRDRQATGQICGGIAGFTCGDPNDRCVIEAQKGCGYADQSGVCRPERNMICTMDYRPVCGCDGKTYGNNCAAGNAGVNINYDGEC